MFTDHAGKLISFTTSDDQVRKGILLPEEFRADEEANTVQVPIIKILSYIEGMRTNDRLATSIELTIKKGWDGFIIQVPSSRKGGIESFADQSILDLVNDGRFEKIGNRMEATLPSENLNAFIRILQTKNVNVALTHSQFEMIKDQFEMSPQRERIIPLKVDTKFQDQEKTQTAVALALALELELFLL